MNKSLILRVGIFVAFFYALTFTFSQVLDVTLSDVRMIVSSFGIFAPIFYTFILLMGLTIPFNPVSDFLVVNVAALLFPPYISIIFTFIAHCTALTINYHVGKKFGKRIIENIASQKNATYIDKFLKRLTIRNLFMLRFFLPTSNVVGVEILSYISGYERLPFKKFFVASIVPWTVLNVIYFISTSYVREKSLSLYFLPAVIIIGLPLGIYFIARDIRRRRA